MQFPPRILFVDDHDDTRFMIETLLGMSGYNVSTAANVESALHMARSAPFDLYVLDSWLADGSGEELCSKIREFDQTTPIIFYSGEVPERLRASLACGAQESVLKPGLDGLREAIFRVMNTQQTSPAGLTVR